MNCVGNPMNLIDEPGWMGAFTRNEVPTALPNGMRIVKVNSEKNDGTPDGTAGLVLGSFSHPEIMEGVVFYFIEWANRPRVAVGCTAWKAAGFFQARDMLNEGDQFTFIGPSPFEWLRDNPQHLIRFTKQPWVMACDKRVWRVKAVESFCIARHRIGVDVGLVAEEWFQ